MGWIIWVAAWVLLGILVLWVGRQLLSNAERKLQGPDIGRYDRDEAEGFATAGRWVGRAAWIIAPLMLLVGTCSTSVHQIPFGNVGILTQFGAIEGQVGEGLQFIPPWKGMMLANVQIQNLGFRGENHLTSFSKESQDVFVEATINFRVSPDAIQALFREVGPNYMDILVVPRVKQNFKDETVKYESVQIAPHREEIRRAVRDRLERELSRNSIEVTDLLVDNISFSKGFQDSIENKQIATQRALEEQQRVQQRKYEAEQQVETAKGEAEATRERANGQADANRALTASLTPEVIQWQAVQKLADKIQIALLPSGQGIIIDPASLLGTTPPRSVQQQPQR